MGESDENEKRENVVEMHRRKEGEKVEREREAENENSEQNLNRRAVTKSIAPKKRGINYEAVLTAILPHLSIKRLEIRNKMTKNSLLLLNLAQFLFHFLILPVLLLRFVRRVADVLLILRQDVNDI